LKIELLSTSLQGDSDLVILNNLKEQPDRLRNEIRRWQDAASREEMNYLNLDYELELESVTDSR
jgi:hypothetical protein